EPQELGMRVLDRLDGHRHAGPAVVLGPTVFGDGARHRRAEPSAYRIEAVRGDAYDRLTLTQPRPEVGQVRAPVRGELESGFRLELLAEVLDRQDLIHPVRAERPSAACDCVPAACFKHQAVRIDAALYFGRLTPSAVADTYR